MHFLRPPIFVQNFHGRLQTVNIIAVDWGKDARKRSAYISKLDSRTISRLPFDGSLAHLVEHASSLAGPVLIGIDAAIGFPASSWRRLLDLSPNPPRTFADFLLDRPPPAAFFEPVARPDEWSPQHPFIRPPSGRWSLRAFVDASHRGLYRQIDSRLHANAMFITSGIPGSVGSGTIALWQEMIAFDDPSAFRVWPFHGALKQLMVGNEPVIGEIYPKACYGIALGESLPAPLLSVAKTSEDTRRDIVAELQATRWLAREQVVICDLDAALANEDDFDALLSAAALTKLLLESAPFESPETTDAVAEGGVLGAACLLKTVRRVARAKSNKSAVAQTSSDRVSTTYPCPIPGCKYVFRNSRSGWDAHVGSNARHTKWHPDVRDADQRKMLFRREFPNWFI